jgi:hypothetical protein
MHNRHTIRRSLLHAASVRAVLTFCVLLVLCGCNMFQKDASAFYVLSIHQFARPEFEPGRSVQFLTNYSGTQRVAVKRIPIVSSHAIMSAVPLPADDESTQAGIRCQLDRHGATLWMQACGAMPGTEVAVAVDGFYCFSIRIPTRVAHPGLLDLRGTWTEKEAEAIAAQAEKNYELLTGKSAIRLPW